MHKLREPQTQFRREKEGGEAQRSLLLNNNSRENCDEQFEGEKYPPQIGLIAMFNIRDLHHHHSELWNNNDNNSDSEVSHAHTMNEFVLVRIKQFACN